MSVNRHWTPEEDAEILRLRGLQMTFSEIAAIIGNNARKQSVNGRWRVLTQGGPKAPVMTQAEHEALIARALTYREKGFSLIEAAKEMGVSEGLLRGRIRKSGVFWRGPGGGRIALRKEEKRARPVHGMSSASVEPWEKKPARKVLPPAQIKMAMCRAFAKGKITRQQLSDGLRGYPIVFDAGV